ncbi:hypothetical protein HPB49_012116 [Dermacentor silvarum]|uniref:Uncharacterized protein n=1 Tax=Dermacentor silvarum TaxID=543639 RepID=A0ACB8CKP6_DERSI|nr:hypothetical protein HPB49_012116 [Dermacentor silvarum]
MVLLEAHTNVVAAYECCYRSGYVSGAYINLPSGHAFRVEPVLVQLATPNASIVGPLAGILVGLTYVYSAITPISDLV